jgi:hypothetical protein
MPHTIPDPVGGQIRIERKQRPQTRTWSSISLNGTQRNERVFTVEKLVQVKNEVRRSGLMLMGRLALFTLVLVILVMSVSASVSVGLVCARMRRDEHSMFSKMSNSYKRVRDTWMAAHTYWTSITSNSEGCEEEGTVTPTRGIVEVHKRYQNTDLIQTLTSRKPKWQFDRERDRFGNADKDFVAKFISGLDGFNGQGTRDKDKDSLEHHG